jgi:hypothetical protein
VVDLAQFEFLGAVEQAGKYGDDSDFLKLLRANHPLTKQDKAAIADLWEGKIKRPPGHQPHGLLDPKKNALDSAVFMVGLVRENGRANGKPIREVDAVEFVFKFMKERGYRMPNRESVLTRLHRSKQPRKSRRKDFSTNSS